MMDISLKRCAGWTARGTLVEFDQDEILLDGVRVGYVGHKPGDAINLIASRLPPDVVGKIKAHVARARSGVQARKVAVAPEIVKQEEE